METMILQLVTAFLGSMGFALLFHLRPHLLLPASLGGLLSWGIYLLAGHYLEGIFAPCLLAAAFSTCYAEVLARLKKAPATLFYITSLIPLIPGNSLYYTMSYAVRGEWLQCRDYGIRTVQFALSIAIGMCLVWAAGHMIHELWLRLQRANLKRYMD